VSSARRRPRAARPQIIGRPPRRAIGPFGALVRLFAALLLGWGSGLLWFALTLPPPAPLSARTDGVVVLTGGRGRLLRGVEVMQAGSARRMLLSGVKRSSTPAMIAEAAGLPLSALSGTDFGHAAIDTRSNAEETRDWVAARRHASIRLVTSAGHMRRARLELDRVLPPGITVIEDAVPHELGAPGVPYEYSKYVARRLALLAGFS
jgi:uncharacterized SAM-binding protein YcdF (DUF218 family)